MKLLFDFFPIVLFFTAYKFYGIFVATAVAIAISFIQVGLYWLKFRRVDTMLLVTCGLVTILGSTTLLLHNEIFIKWKPTAIYWLLGIIFLASQFLTEKSLIERTLDNNIDIPAQTWNKLNLSWVAFFFICGALNIYVIYHYDTNTWVNFKLFGIIGLTLIFIILQGLFLYRYIEEDSKKQIKEEQ